MSSPYVWERVTARDPHLRAADADRERIAERLRTGHTEGRLDLAEFQQRLERGYAAKTLGELDELVSDLPASDERPAVRRTGPGWRPAALVPILIALILVSAVVRHPVFAWLWVPVVLMFWRMSWWRHRRWLAAGRL
jgi:DUF1707 SHOCT-like domain